MLTLFATLKPMKGEAEVHQANAVKSWPAPEIILYGQESADFAAEMGIRCEPGVDRESGIPRLDSIFKLAQKHASNDLIGYLNADVVIVDGLMEAVEQVKGLPQFLMVCRRWDIDLDEELDFSGDWRAFVKRRIREHKELHSDCSSDLFLFRRPLWDLPPFTPGRPEWDNWMFWKACDAGWPVVDATKAVTMAHPNHGYGVNGTMDVKTFWRTEPLVERNRSLGGHGKQYCLRHVKAAGRLWELGERLRSLTP